MLIALDFLPKRSERMRGWVYRLIILRSSAGPVSVQTMLKSFLITITFVC